MRTALSRRWIGAAAVAALAFAASTSTGAGALPADSYSKAIEADIAHIGTLLDMHKAKPTDKGIPAHIKATAMLLASYAQDNLDGKDADKMAALRAAALKVAEAVTKKDMDGMAKAAAALKSVAADPKADKTKLKLYSMHKLDLREVMNLFGQPKNGGMNIEKDIRSMKKDGVKDAKLAELIGVRTMVIGELTIDLPPTFTAKRKKEDWDRWMKDMNSEAAELTAEASKGAKADAAKMKKTITSLDATCVNCHNVFREP